MQSTDIPYKFQHVWAAGAGAGPIVDPIPDSGASGGHGSQQTGFAAINAQPIGSGGVPPWISDTNGVLKYITAWQQWVQAWAQMPYDATFQGWIGGYPKGAIVSSLDTGVGFGGKWLSTVENNMTNPDLFGAGWMSLQHFTGGDLQGFFPAPTLIAGAAANNVGGLGGDLTGSLPNPNLRAGAAAGNVGGLGGDLTGSLPNPTIKASVNLTGFPTAVTRGGSDNTVGIATTAMVQAALVRAHSLTRPVGYRDNVDGTRECWFLAAVPCGGGIVSTIVSIPFLAGGAMPNDVLKLGICFGSDATPSPPGADNPGSIAIDYNSNSNVKVTTNYINIASLGVRIELLGF